jgi:hypothetical protein
MSNNKEQTPSQTATGSSTTEPVKRGLAVIGAGYGRTGTASMQQALNLLGFGPCYHMREVFKDPTGVQKWDQVGLNNDKNVDWDTIFHGYQSTVDFPAASYYKELHETYPDAKVILNVRDPEKWWDSYKETICPRTPLWNLILAVTAQRNFTADRMVANCVYKAIAGSRAKARDKQAAIAGFLAHNEEVKATIPADKLLVFEVKEGWEPLCKFLECPVPKDTPFPHTNDAEQFQKMIILRKKKALMILAAEVTLVVAGLFWVRGGKSRSS